MVLMDSSVAFYVDFSQEGYSSFSIFNNSALESSDCLLLEAFGGDSLDKGVFKKFFIRFKQSIYEKLKLY